MTPELAYNQHALGNIPQVSNELEFNLSKVSAKELLESTDLPIVAEVNPRDIVELNVSLATNVDELNIMLEELTINLRTAAQNLGGDIYAGSSLIQDVSDVIPARYRTTCLSESCARGFLDITSQQIVIGVKGEEFGINLYNYLRTATPLFLALSASSPYRINGDKIINTGFLSRRILSYQQLCRMFPQEMLESPVLESTSDFFERLQTISDNVLNRLESNQLDANLYELCLSREGGAHFPFDCLDPHQIYWMTRFRPDHQTDQSDFSLELRVCDIPTSISEMQALNSFVLGLCYYAADNGFGFPYVQGEELTNLNIAARDGLAGRISGRLISDQIIELRSYSSNGLLGRGYNPEQMEQSITSTIEQGTSAEKIQRANIRDPSELRKYLIDQLEARP